MEREADQCSGANSWHGVETIHDIKKILEKDGFITKTKVGHDYGDIKNYEF